MTTYITKKGFGGLLKEGLECEIVKRNEPRQGDVLIKIKNVSSTANAFYAGKMKDLVKK